MEINFKMYRGFAKKNKDDMLRIMKNRGVHVVIINNKKELINNKKEEGRPKKIIEIIENVKEEDNDNLSQIIKKMKEEMINSINKMNEKEIIRLLLKDLVKLS
jgi:Cft2 family RNA processing exonuclease